MYVYTLVLDLPMPEGSENMAPVDRRGWCAALSLSLWPLCAALASCPAPRAQLPSLLFGLWQVHL